MSELHRHFEIVDSTNSVARDWAREGAPHGAIVTAEAQTAGRGRRGRDWVSPGGRGVYLSVVWRPQIESAPGKWTILMALAGARAIEMCCGLKPSFKWPNDILMNGRKIGGVLCEAEWKDSQLDFVIGGLGLNVLHESVDLPERPIFPASSLWLETGARHEIEDVAQACIQSLKVLWARFENSEWADLKHEFETRCAGLGELVTVSDEGQKYFGVARGLDDHGLLLVATADGLRTVSAGDVSYD